MKLNVQSRTTGEFKQVELTEEELYDYFGISICIDVDDCNYDQVTECKLEVTQEYDHKGYKAEWANKGPKIRTITISKNTRKRIIDIINNKIFNRNLFKS